MQTLPSPLPRMSYSACFIPGKYALMELVRVVLFNYRKAFNLIDHIILAEKLMALDVPHGILCWIIDLQTKSQARARL